MRANATGEFFYQLIALLVTIIIVHAFYVAIVWPRSDAILAEQEERQAQGLSLTGVNSIWVIVKDYEQESEIILAIWAVTIIVLKVRNTQRERKLLEGSVFVVTPGTSILPEDTREYSRPLQSLPPAEREGLLARALLAALQRFGSTRNVADVSTAIREVCETESDRLDSDLSLIRYIIWAIPAIGFIGTVRGIGMALTQADQAVQGNIVGVVGSLGTAFNSTLVALLISIVIMFLVHQLQQMQERLVLDTQQYCDINLVRHLQVR
jgi:biopolymer transport protein ExbB/TolQ